MKKALIIILVLCCCSSFSFADFKHDNRDAINYEKNRLKSDKKMIIRNLKIRFKNCHNDFNCRNYYEGQIEEANAYFKAKLRQLRKDPEDYFYGKNHDDPDVKIRID